MPRPEIETPSKIEPGRTVAGTAAIRLAIVVSHPIQHFVHFYRAIAREPDIALKVFFCARIGVDDYFDREMNVSIAWKTDLLSGYDHEFLPEAAGIRSTGFRNVNNPAVTTRLAAFAPDVVITYGYAAMTALRVMAWCRFRAIPLMMISDTTNFARRSPAKAVTRRILVGTLLSQVSAFLTAGDSNEAALRDVGVSPARMFRSPFTIDEAAYGDRSTSRSESRTTIRKKFGIPEDAFVVLYVGKMYGGKRPADILDAAARIRTLRTARPIWFLMCGNGEYFETAKARIVAEQLPVTLAGFVNVDELPLFYAAADALAHPAERDAHPLVCSEAAATRLPMVLSDRIGAIGPSDIAQEGQNALVYRCGDTEALATNLARLSSDEKMYAAMAEASGRIFRACDVKASIGGLRAALASCLKLQPGIARADR